MKRVVYLAAAVLMLSLAAQGASARDMDSGGGLGSTSSQYTGYGYWPDIGAANSPRGGQSNAMTTPLAPWLSNDQQVPSPWRAWEAPTPAGRTQSDQGTSTPQAAGAARETPDARPRS